MKLEKQYPLSFGNKPFRNLALTTYARTAYLSGAPKHPIFVTQLQRILRET